MDYNEPSVPIKRCGNCKHGAISRRAYIPGWQCLLMEEKFIVASKSQLLISEQEISDYKKHPRLMHG